ncbi:MAG: N-acetyltransferase [Plesiomonas sp.]
MIRLFTETDMDTLLNVWLTASIDAHDFVEPHYWHSKIDSMRTQYFPSAMTWVYEDEGEVKGFYSLAADGQLAALFVDPQYQNVGIGTELLAHAKQQMETLTLTVYAENLDAVRLYKKHGFSIQNEQPNPYTGHKEFVMATV